MSNLPPWEGAKEAYGDAYRLLERMAAAGHATAPIMSYGRGKPRVLTPGGVSWEMKDLIDALNKGDEGRIRNYLMEPPC